MRVSVFGVGYVGCVTGACLAREGHQVIGVDVDPFKVKAINEGRAPFYEPGLNELVAAMVSAGRLRATLDHADAVKSSDVAFICVGTPSRPDGSSRIDYLAQVVKSIATHLRSKNGYFVVALRSTVLPTVFEQELLPRLEEYSGKSIGTDIGFVYNPEFLREGAALRDFSDAPWTVVGAADAKAGDVVASLYQGFSTPILRTDPRTASLLKYFSNAFHALKVVFGNEVGSFCREMGVDGAELMEIFVRDTKLNISRSYLKPGFAFGGSCLPKDLRVIVSEIGKRGLKLPVLESILTSNEHHLRSCIQMVAETEKRRIGLVGLSFKEGTDDLRESPAVELAERLIGKGFNVRIYEPSIGPGKLRGANLDFIERTIPHIWKLLVDNLADLIRDSEVLVVMQQISQGDALYFNAMKSGQVCIDLARALTPGEVSGEYRSMVTPLRNALLESLVSR